LYPVPRVSLSAAARDSIAALEKDVIKDLLARVHTVRAAEKALGIGYSVNTFTETISPLRKYENRRAFLWIWQPIKVRIFPLKTAAEAAQNNKLFSSFDLIDFHNPRYDP